MSRFLKSTLFSLFAALFLATMAHAQGIPGVGTPLTLSSQPTSPRPGETVVFTLQSFSVNLDKSSITWTVDGKIVASGTGIKTVSTVAGKLGSIKNLSVAVSSPESGEFTETALIRPSDVALLWQAATYVPPFYQGKTLHAIGGTYKVVAIPEITDASGKRIDPRTLVYTWKKNDAIEKDASGYGKNSFVSTQTGFVRQGDEVTVEITSAADNFTVTKSILVSPVDPELLVYERNPLYGTIYEKELGASKELIDQEITIGAEPYYFSTKEKASSYLNYTWTLNDEPIAAFGGESFITLRRAGNSAGLSQIGLTVENAAKILQSAARSLTIRYE